MSAAIRSAGTQSPHWRTPRTFRQVRPSTCLLPLLHCVHDRLDGAGHVVQAVAQLDHFRGIGVVEQVQSLLLQPGDTLTLASRLGMTSRTLARRLGSRGRYCQDVKDQVRLDKVTQLLRHTQMSVNGIAEATGFRSVRRFRNFFTRH